MHLRLLPVALAMTFAPALLSQGYVEDFETLAGSAAGTVLTGQDGYYLPNATSVDWNVYTYAGNPLSVPANGATNYQFIGGTGPAGGIFARGQRNVTYDSISNWRVTFDVCVGFVGTLPTAQNIGSFSLQDSATSAHFIMLARWSSTATATNWNADFVHYPGNGTAGATVVIPDSNFQNLNANQWYRWEVDWDFVTARVLAIRLTDLSTSSTYVYEPPDWFLRFGAMPTAFRWFAGGGVSGNVVAIDNADISPLQYGQYGTGCPGSAGIPQLSPFLGTTPSVGTTFLAEVTNMPGPTGFGVMVTGLSDTMHQTFVLPFDLGVIGAPGCFARASHDATALLLSASGMTVWSLGVPNNPGLAGIRFFNQCFVFDATANALQFTVTAGARGSIR